MSGDGTSTASSTSAPLSAAALAEWSHHVECVLRGIAHTLNNRAAALSAVIELSREPGGDASGTAAILSTELDRMGELAASVTLIGSPRRGMEAFAPSDAAAEALGVLQLHAEQHDPPTTIEARTAPAIRVPRWMFVRALVALGADASAIRLGDEGEWVAVRADAARAPGASPRVLVAELARLMGGEPLAGDQAGFRVPSLAAVRQREGR